MTPALLYSLRQRRRRTVLPEPKAHESVVTSDGDPYTALVGGKIFLLETDKATVLAVPDSAMHLVEDVVANLRTEKPVVLTTEDGDTHPHGETDILCEMTFARLVQLTRQNGQYKVGGLRKVGGVWINDPSIPGRAQNARFVVTQPGTVERDDDGMLVMRFRYSSRPDRNTTGGSHTGYIKFLEPKGFFKRMLRRLLPARQMDQEVETSCTCQDFKFRFAKLLSDQGAGAKTYGIADQYPLKTNPTGKLSLCKHLIGIAPLLQMRRGDEDKLKKDFDRDTLYVRGRDKSPGVVDGAEVEDL